MPMVEIDEEELRKNAELRKTLSAIMAKPAAKLKLLEAHKLANPDAAVPELDQQEHINTSLAGIQKTVDDFVKSQKEERETTKRESEQARVKASIEEGFGKLRQAGVTDDGIKGVEELMAREGIINPEIAWSHFEKLHPQPAPVVPSSVGAWNFLQPQADAGEDIKQLIDSRGENNQILDKLVRDGLNEVRGGISRR